MSFTTRSEQKSCGGTFGLYTHHSETLGLDANFAVFLPGEASTDRPVPVLYTLAGLTCTEETFLTKSNAVRFAARHGLALVAPDTSPRGAGIPGEDDSYDLGTAAGFYLDATRTPWAAHYRMGSYLSEELPALIRSAFPIDDTRRGITGHSMGGHGALVHALRAPDRWKSVSAFAPIVHPASCPWGEKAFTAYLGSDPDSWASWDATLLLRAGYTHPTPILIDQGDADQFLTGELKTHYIEEAARNASQSLHLRMQPDYDHSYWFIQTFIEDHIVHHAKILKS
ncbi:S-formylglutathione hydrolase [Acetobacter sp. AN02]|uniref:S-formylglutathione hydrolase n=1 Tax=Acetobacter sp. AN02 TaxID=2894186 RepID=UPI0024342B0E|nr:S-formylglutathione hydrolase [Acetobacter sp. AN02]MDG6095696.1 S-formylglutathione hydrolase [Acetobacter sp. AN02]